MFIKQLYTGCLSEAAYFIESDGEAAVIDPLRDIEVYLELAKERKAIIKYIFETHFHADFVSGHLDLAKITGAPIVYGPNTETQFPIRLAKDGEIIPLGAITLEVLHTPGHTVESTCYLLRDEEGHPHCLFSGDTLFVGDVGRPDLSSGNLSSEALANLLFDSIHNKILPLANDILVYPAHGPGSSCGKNLGPTTFSTIGDEKKNNYALQPTTREEFVKVVTEGLDAAPEYFAINARINKEGYESLEALLRQGLQALDVSAFKKFMEDENTIVLDTRNADAFSEGFIPGSIFIGLEGRFAEWAANLLPFDHPILLVSDPGKEEETIIRLARVGFENVRGYLQGGLSAWGKAGESIDLIIDIDTEELAIDIPFDEKMVILDVRKLQEFAEGHIKNAINLPLADFKDPVTLASLDERDNIYVHCGGGYRSMIASAILKKEGFHNIRNILGGWNKIKLEKRIPIEKEKAVLN